MLPTPNTGKKNEKNLMSFLLCTVGLFTAHKETKITIFRIIYALKCIVDTVKTKYLLKKENVKKLLQIFLFFVFIKKAGFFIKKSQYILPAVHYITS